MVVVVLVVLGRGGYGGQKGKLRTRRNGGEEKMRGEIRQRVGQRDGGSEGKDNTLQLFLDLVNRHWDWWIP